MRANKTGDSFPRMTGKSRQKFRTQKKAHHERRSKSVDTLR